MKTFKTKVLGLGNLYPFVYPPPPANSVNTALSLTPYVQTLKITQNCPQYYLHSSEQELMVWYIMVNEPNKLTNISSHQIPQTDQNNILI